MEKALAAPSTSSFRNYCMLTKPGIIFGNAVTAFGGFALASKTHFDFLLFIVTLIGLSLIIASACVLNNYIDRELDAKMKRTRNRVLVKKLISTQNAIVFAIILCILGTLTLTFYTNTLTTMLALGGVFVYLALYSPLKYLSIHGTLVGSIAGAVSPIVGYSAVTQQLDIGALIVFLMIMMWQMPHFFAIAIYRIDDYLAGSIPVLPIKKGLVTTKIHMLLYTTLFMIISLMPTLFGYTGYAYLTIAVLLSTAWLLLCLKGFKCKNDKIWARQMFFFSLLIVMMLSVFMSFKV